MLIAATKLNVRYQETDRMGIVYHSNYFVWFEIGRTELFKKIGVSYPDLEKNNYFLVVTDASCKYKAPAAYDDEVEVITQLAKSENCSLIFNYKVKKDGMLIASGTTRHAFVDARGKIARIPSTLVEALNKEGVKSNRIL